MTGSIVIGVRRGRGPAADASRGSDPGDGGLPIEAVRGHVGGESLLAQPYDEGDPLRGRHRCQLFALFLRHGVSHSAAHVASIRERSRPSLGPWSFMFASGHCSCRTRNRTRPLEAAAGVACNRWSDRVWMV